jgi:hypothetical protein
MALEDGPIQFTKDEKTALLKLIIMGMYRCMELKRQPPREVPEILQKIIGREIGIRLPWTEKEEE